MIGVGSIYTEQLDSNDVVTVCITDKKEGYSRILGVEYQAQQAFIYFQF